MAAGGGGGGRASSSAASSSAGALEASLDRKLQAVTNTMESIQGLSSWCLENKRHHNTIVYHWMKWLRRCECGQRSGRAGPPLSPPVLLSAFGLLESGPGLRAGPPAAGRWMRAAPGEGFLLLRGFLSSHTLWEPRSGFPIPCSKGFSRAVLLGRAVSVSGGGAVGKGQLRGCLPLAECCRSSGLAVWLSRVPTARQRRGAVMVVLVLCQSCPAQLEGALRSDVRRGVISQRPFGVALLLGRLSA